MLSEVKIREIFRAAMEDDIVLKTLINDPSKLKREYNLDNEDIESIEKFFKISESREKMLANAKLSQEIFITEGKSWAT
jgi:hypothetical protein